MDEKEYLNRLDENRRVAHIKEHPAQMKRSGSLTVGPSVSSTVTVSMMSPAGEHVWTLLDRESAAAIITNIATSIGCDVEITPKKSSIIIDE